MENYYKQKATERILFNSTKDYLYTAKFPISTPSKTNLK